MTQQEFEAAYFHIKGVLLGEIVLTTEQEKADAHVMLWEMVNYTGEGPPEEHP